MALAELWRAHRKNFALKKRDQKSEGFALVSLIALVPLCLTLASALGFAFKALSRKSSAQALCVRQVVQLQTELGQNLRKLLRLNPRAKSLRQARTRAELKLKIALLSGNGPAIAAAKAEVLAVQLAQVELHLEQDAILTLAQEARSRAPRELQLELKSLRPAKFSSQQLSLLALAVKPIPLASPSPDYVLVENFEVRQLHAFSFSIALQPHYWPVTVSQVTRCAASLQQKGTQWTAKILVASALSKPRLFSLF